MRKVLALIVAALLAVVLIYAIGDRTETGVSGETEARQVLRRGNGAEPQTLDPALADDYHGMDILADVYEGLVTFAADGSVIPGVAEDWDVSEDGTVWTFVLRQDARWSNGDVVTAEDFVRGFHRVAHPDTAANLGFLFEPLENFDSIKKGELPVTELGAVAVGDHRLELRLNAPATHFLSVLAMTIASPVHASVNEDTIGEPATFVGNGPYVLETWQPLAVIRLRRNEYFWDAESVSIPEVEYVPIEDESAEMNMYRAGELDITNAIPPASIDMLRESIPDEVRIAPRLALYYLAFDLTEPPFDDANLRRALSLAMDRQQLVDLIGRGEIAAYGIVPDGVANHEPARYDWQGLDDAERIALAQEAFAQAGYGPTNPLEINFVYNTGSIHERLVLAVISMWQDALVDIEVELDKREWVYFLETRDKREEWDVMRFSWIGDYNDPMTFVDIFRSESPQNLPRYVNAEYDQLVGSALGEQDPDARLEQLTTAEQMLLDDYPIAPVYYFVSKHLVKPWVGGFEENPLDRHPSRFLTLDADN